MCVFILQILLFLEISATVKQPYINYKPSDHHTETGYAISLSLLIFYFIFRLSIDRFETAASNAVLDLTGDETNEMQKAKRIRKW